MDWTQTSTSNQLADLAYKSSTCGQTTRVSFGRIILLTASPSVFGLRHKVSHACWLAGYALVSTCTGGGTCPLYLPSPLAVSLLCHYNKPVTTLVIPLLGILILVQPLSYSSFLLLALLTMAPPSAIEVAVEGTRDADAVVLPDPPLTVQGVSARRAKAGKLIAGTAAYSDSDFFKSPGAGKPKARRWDRKSKSLTIYFL